MKITGTIPIRTVSEANGREHWAAKARRVKSHRYAAWALTLDLLVTSNGQKLSPPFVVTLTRHGKRKLDSDNLQSALKATRDGVAEALGIDDGSDLIEWRYDQHVGKYEVGIEIETAALAAREGV